MATALSFLSSTLLAPVQAVVLFFAPHATVGNRAPAPRPASVQPSASPTAARSQHAADQYTRTRGRIHDQTHDQTRAHAPTQVLRVLRLSDAGIPAGSAGRMRMSGRFADVCAELDRMAAQEIRAV